MPSVVGLLEQHERAARRRADRLREEADRIQAELTAAEREWEEWAIARRRVDAVLVLSLDYQRILQALADRDRLGQGVLTCQELAVAFGLEAVPAKVEALRSKEKRLVARGWLAEPAPGRFTLAKDVAGPGGGS